MDKHFDLQQVGTMGGIDGEPNEYSKNIKHTTSVLWAHAISLRNVHV